MMEIANLLLKKWYIPAAALLTLWFAFLIMEKYPSRSGIGKSDAFQVQKSDSLLAVFHQIQQRRRNAGLSKSVSAGKDLFETPQTRTRISRKTGPVKPALPPRNFRLMGISNSRSAIVENTQGVSRVVEPGDIIDSAVVREIKSDRIILKDRSGIFEIFIKD
jgi:hypothetical protein